MTPLPAPLGGAELIAWRLDLWRMRTAWDSGEGSYLAGGRWNSRGIRAVYCSIDPATAILEVAVHKGFSALDIVPHALTALKVTDLSRLHVVDPTAVPDQDWLRPGIPVPGQQSFGDALLAKYGFVVIPSVVSSHSWNLIFVESNASLAYALLSQERFVLDRRLQLPSSP